MSSVQADKPGDYNKQEQAGRQNGENALLKKQREIKAISTFCRNYWAKHVVGTV